MASTNEKPFDIYPHLLHLIQEVPFYAEISRNITKRYTKAIPTCAIGFDKKQDDFIFLINPEFMSKLSNLEIHGVIIHEFYHFIFQHVTARLKNPMQNWNIATDLAINSLIYDSYGNRNDGLRPLPEFALVPGVRPVVKNDGTKISKQEEAGSKIADLIENFPKMKASEWYFNEIQKFAQENPECCSAGEGLDGFGSMDDHTGWGDVPDGQEEYVSSRAKAILEKAVKNADSSSNGWGNIPQELREDIRRSVTNIVDWRAVYRQFIGSVLRGGRSTSIKRINRRYPYIHPGLKRGYKAKLLIARDESGSVSDEMMADFFGELASLTRRTEVDLLPFDCGADEKDIVRWRKGTIPFKAGIRTRTGGTDFNAPTEIFNDPKNRGRWDGMLILTDGCAPAPMSSRGKRGWVLAKGCKLEFSSDELQIFVSNDRSMQGAWR